MRSIDAPVHLIGWAQQPDLERVCDYSFTQPKWGTDADRSTTDPRIHVDDDDKLYTFDPKKVTCEHCLARMKES